MHLISPADSLLYWAAVTAFTFAIATGVLRRWALDRPGVRRGAVFVAMFVASALVVGLLPSAVFSMARGPGGSRVTPQTAMSWSAGIVAGAIGLGVLARAIVGDPSRGRRRCAKCWYDLSATAGLKCPECGREARSERGLFRTRRRKRWFALAGMLLVASAGAGIVPVIVTDGWERWTPTTVLVVVMPHLQDGKHGEMLNLLRHRIWNELDERQAGSAEARPAWWRRFAARRCIATIGRPNRENATEAAIMLSVLLDEEREPVTRRVIELWSQGNLPIKPRVMLGYFYWLPEDEELFAVVTALLDHMDPEVRSRAVTALAYTGDRSSHVPPHPRMLEIAASDPDARTRRSALHALRAYEQTEQVQDVLLAAQEDSDSIVRSATLSTLTALDPNSDERIAARVRALTDSDFRLAYTAARLIAGYGPYDEATSRAVLALAARGQGGIEAIEEWLWVLSRVGTPEAMIALELALDVPEVRLRALRAVADFGERALPLLPRLERLDIEAKADPDASANWRPELDAVLIYLRRLAEQQVADEAADSDSAGDGDAAGTPLEDQ